MLLGDVCKFWMVGVCLFGGDFGKYGVDIEVFLVEL